MGAVSGAFAAAATTPLDVIKTTMMCTAASRPTMTGAAVAAWKNVRSPDSVLNSVSFLLKIWSLLCKPQSLGCYFVDCSACCFPISFKVIPPDNCSTATNCS